MKHKKKITIGVLVLIAVIAVGITINKLNQPQYPHVRVQKGSFESTIEVVGELLAQSSTDITIPSSANNENVNIRQIKIIDIIQEGSIVKKGNWVASLDPTEPEEMRRQAQDMLDQYLNNLETARLDSNMVLTDARNEIQKAKDNLDDKILKVEQSFFESKAIQRQAVIEKEMADRKLDRSKRNYDQRQRKYNTQIKRYEENVKKREEERDIYSQLIRDLRIMAPSDGMVVYAKGWDGNKIKTGSFVSRWNPTILSLPDLNSLVSETYIREVDFAKVTTGQKVRLKIDAFPGKEFTGQITDIANVGQNIPGEQQVGFKALIKVDKSSELLLPSMTTNNIVILQTWPDALIVPRKALFRDGNKNVVYQQSLWGITKHEVTILRENDQQIMIDNGVVRANAKILTEIPAS